MANAKIPRQKARAPAVLLCACAQAPLACIALISAVCALVPFSATARADDQEAFKCPAPGTVLEFTGSGGKISFTGQDGMWCTGTGTSGQPWRRYALLASAGSKFIDNHVERIWPLEVGKEISFAMQGTSNNVTGDWPDYVPWYEETIRVLRKERVTVQAGTFDSWVIEVREDMTHGRFTGISTYWYAPDLGYGVKYTYHVAAGIGKDNAFEAKAISSAAPVLATPAPAPSSPASATAAQRLLELKDLLERKLITPSEYETRRKGIIDAL